jgi:hypothetical protein
MSFYHFFKLKNQSKVLGEGRYKFDCIKKNNLYFYHRPDDEQHQIINNNKSFHISEYGMNFLKQIYKESGGFFYSYSRLGKKEGVLDFINTNMLSDKEICHLTSLMENITLNQVYLLKIKL